ncbi:MAG: c-type cytochrome [Anaerolineales bacterium]
MKSKLLRVLMVAALTLAACGSSGSATPTLSPEAQKYAAFTANAANGKAKFDVTCVACHGPTGQGVPGLGKDLTMSEFTAGRPDAELALFLSVGRGTDDPLNTTGIAMLPKGGNPALTDQDLVDIVAYLRSIHK